MKWNICLQCSFSKIWPFTVTGPTSKVRYGIAALSKPQIQLIHFNHTPSPSSVTKLNIHEQKDTYSYKSPLLSQLNYNHYSTIMHQPGSQSPQSENELKLSEPNRGNPDIGKDDSSTPVDQDSKPKSRWSNWTGKNSWKAGLVFLGLSFGTFAGTLVYTWGAPQRDQDGELVEDSFSKKPAIIAYSQRAWAAVMDFFQMVKDPTSEKLLPDPLVYPYMQPPYTLVLEISGLLLKPEWDLKMGWRFKKRPGIDYFLQTAAQSGFEIVIFTTEPAAVAYPLTASMDTQGVIWYRLFKEDTRYTKGVHIKDLNCLNRDLSKVVLLDVCKEHYQLNPRNGLALRKWEGKDDDRELYDLSAFLQTIAANKVEDVRAVLQYYNDFDDPMAKFRENQAALLKTQSELNQLQTEERAKKSQGVKSPFISSDLRRR